MIHAIICNKTTTLIYYVNTLSDYIHTFYNVLQGYSIIRLFMDSLASIYGCFCCFWLVFAGFDCFSHVLPHPGHAAHGIINA